MRKFWISRKLLAESVQLNVLIDSALSIYYVIIVWYSKDNTISCAGWQNATQCVIIDDVGNEALFSAISKLTPTSVTYICCQTVFVMVVIINYQHRITGLSLYNKCDHPPINSDNFLKW